MHQRLFARPAPAARPGGVDGSVRPSATRPFEAQLGPQLAAAPRIVALGAMLLGAAAFARPAALPPPFAAALQRAGIAPAAVAALVEPLDERTPRRGFAWRPDIPVNPASVMKLVTSFAALDTLGPAWTWSTPVWLQGELRDGVLDGNLVIRGSGDPQLVQERVWLLLQRVRGLGVRTIRGDIVLDRGAFSLATSDPATFDGEPLRPYNVAADALLLNWRSVQFRFTPDPARGVAHIALEPALAGVRVVGIAPADTGPLAPADLPLVTTGACGPWRTTLGPQFGDPTRPRFTGRYPAACGEQTWALAYPEPARYDERLLLGLWAEMGGAVVGRVREGTAPSNPPTFTIASPPLAAVVRDLNKYSNNVMAQQLFLTLGTVWGGSGNGSGSDDTAAAARAGLRRWAAERFGERAAAGLVVDNGSGLSREGRVTARFLARLLQAAWSSPVMPELLASLPADRIDGTLASADAPSDATSVPASRHGAHLKTGSLRDVAALAGLVLADSGRRYLLVAIVNDPAANTPAARAALAALVHWTADDAAGSAPGGRPERGRGRVLRAL